MKRFIGSLVAFGVMFSTASFADINDIHIKKVHGKIRALDTLSIHTYKLSKSDVESIEDNDGKLTDYFARKIAKRYEINPVDSDNITLGYHYLNPKKTLSGCTDIQQASDDNSEDKNFA